MAELKKICKKCNKKRLIKFFRYKIARGLGYYSGACRDCEYKYTKNWRVECEEKYNAIKEKRKLIGQTEHDKKVKREWRNNNYNYITLYSKKRKRKIRKNLEDDYVLQCLLRDNNILKTKDIREKAPILIDAKREQLKLFRLSHQ